VMASASPKSANVCVSVISSQGSRGPGSGVPRRVGSSWGDDDNARVQATGPLRDDPAVTHLDPFPSQTRGLLHFVARQEAATCCDHPPPRKRAVGSTPQQRAHGASRAGVPGLGCDFAVGHEVSRSERVEDGARRLFEVGPGRAVGVHVSVGSRRRRRVPPHRGSHVDRSEPTRCRCRGGRCRRRWRAPAEVRPQRTTGPQG